MSPGACVGIALLVPVLASANEADHTVCVAAENVALKGMLELAESRAHYLIADPAGLTLTLAYEGVMLVEFPLLAIDATADAVESPGTASLWGPHLGGNVAPARAEQPDEAVTLQIEGQANDVVLIPLQPSDRYLAPPVFEIVFESGFIIRVATEKPDSSFHSRLATGLGRWFGRQSERLADVHATMSADAAGDLYRALEPPLMLVIRPPCGSD